MASVDRILIRGTNWIGDSVLSLAAMRELRRLFPTAHLSLLIKPWVVGLFEGQAIVDEILSYGDQPLMAQASRIRKSGFDLSVLLTNSFSTAALTWLARIPERAGYRTDLRSVLLTRTGRPRIKTLGRHQVYYYLDLLHQSGLSDRDYLQDASFQPDTSLGVTTLAKQQAAEHLVDLENPIVALNPGAFYGRAKRWFPERYAKVGDLLATTAGASIVLVGSRGERPLAKMVADQMATDPRILTGETSLESLLGVLAACDLFITNDSGPMHLAAALGTPQIGLFGSTDEIATGPLSPRATIIHKHVACNPCLLRECPIDLRCFERIGVEEVAQTALSMLSATKTVPPASQRKTP